MSFSKDFPKCSTCGSEMYEGSPYYYFCLANGSHIGKPIHRLLCEKT